MLIEAVLSANASLRVVMTNAEKTEGYIEVDLRLHNIEIGANSYISAVLYVLRANREIIYQEDFNFIAQKVVE